MSRVLLPNVFDQVIQFQTRATISVIRDIEAVEGMRYVALRSFEASLP